MILFSSSAQGRREEKDWETEWLREGEIWLINQVHKLM